MRCLLHLTPRFTAFRQLLVAAGVIAYFALVPLGVAFAVLYVEQHVEWRGKGPVPLACDKNGNWTAL